MIVNAGYRGKVGAAAPKFTYTGQYNIRKDGVVELLTSGTIVFLEPKVIDVFMVGGGASGMTPSGSQSQSHQGYGGGGGGYTRTVKHMPVLPNNSYTVTIGAGGVAASDVWNNPGGASAFNNYTVPGAPRQTVYTAVGATGGSGGGGGVASNSDYGAGGSDGNNGETGYPTRYSGGTGQGFTTREFGEAAGKLYAGAGGGGRYMSAQSPVISAGGSGGGGSGSWASPDYKYQAAAAGVANTGGGGGGGVFGVNNSHRYPGGSGGSGIVCFRDAAALPELAGTWVLNERLYKSANIITENINYTIGNTTCNGFHINKDYVMTRVTGQSGYSYIYKFATNEWAISERSITITSTTASDEFRAWLASNATKQ